MIYLVIILYLIGIPLAYRGIKKHAYIGISWDWTDVLVCAVMSLISWPVVIMTFFMNMKIKSKPPKWL